MTRIDIANKSEYPTIDWCLRYRSLVLTLLVLSLLACSSDPVTTLDPGFIGDGQLEPRLEEILLETDVPALGVAFIEAGGITEMGAVGVRAIGHSAVVTTQDKWHLGSITKAMTATMIARFVDRGAIEWSTTVEEIFAEDLVKILPIYYTVRLDELMYHTSGIHNDVRSVPSWGLIADRSGREMEQRHLLAVELMGIPPAQKRGGYYYANSGYVVAGAMIEAVTGKPWRQLMREELFIPLDMANTGFWAPGSPGVQDEPWGHDTSRGGFREALDPGLERSDNPPAMGPAGLVHSTFEDYSRYLIMHMKGAIGESDFLEPETFQKLHTPAPGVSTALGWFSETVNGGRQNSHDGSNGFWFARAGFNVNDQNGVLFVTNQGGQGAKAAIDGLNILYSKRIGNTK